MKAHEGPGHEERLVSLLAGHEDPLAILARSPLSACPACHELVSLGTRLDALGMDERAALAAGRAGGGRRGRAEERARAEILAELERARPNPWRRLAPWLVAAAVLVTLVALRPGSGARPDPDPKLGPGSGLEHPLGKVTSFGPFRWAAAGPEAGWYRVVVEPWSREGTLGPPTDSGRIVGTSWEPSVEEQQRWGDRIRWTLEVYRATGAGDLVSSASASAELSSR